MISVLTYNIEFGKRLNEILVWLTSLEDKPQIICLQEFPEKELEKLRKINIFNNQKVYFAKGLSSKEESFGEVTIVNGALIKVEDEIYLDFGKDFAESLYKRQEIKRSALILKCSLNDIHFTISNLHLTPLALNKTRREQIEKVLKNVNTPKSIILGDFNYSNILTRGGLLSLMSNNEYLLAGEKLITNKYKYKIPQQLDYVFYKGFELKDVLIDPHVFSDHFPVFAHFK